MTKTSFGDQLHQMWQTRPVRLPRQGPVAGVAAGFGQRYNIDPVVVRVALVVSTIFGGAGVVLYLLAWLLLSESGDQASPAESLFGKGQSSQSQTKTIVLIVALAIAVSTMGPVGVGLAGSGLISMALMLAGWWMLHMRNPQPPPGTSALGAFDGGLNATGYPGAVFPRQTMTGDFYPPDVPPTGMYTPYTKLPDAYVPDHPVHRDEAPVDGGDQAQADAETVVLNKSDADTAYLGKSDAGTAPLDKDAAQGDKTTPPNADTEQLDKSGTSDNSNADTVLLDKNAPRTGDKTAPSDTRTEILRTSSGSSTADTPSNTNVLPRAGGAPATDASSRPDASAQATGSESTPSLDKTAATSGTSGATDSAHSGSRANASAMATGSESAPSLGKTAPTSGTAPSKIGGSSSSQAEFPSGTRSQQQLSPSPIPTHPTLAGVTPPSWDPLGVAPLAWDLPDPTPTPTIVAQPKRPRSRLTPVVLGLAILAAAGAGAMAASGVDWMTPGRIAAVALAVIGLGLVAGAFLRRGYGLLVLTAPLAGFVMLASLIGPIEFDSATVGDRVWAPTTMADLAPSYELTMGSGTLDLQSLKLTENRAVEVAVQMGEANIVLPADMTVRTTCNVNMGEANCPTGITGPNTPGAPVLDLKVNIRAGSVEVRRG